MTRDVRRYWGSPVATRVPPVRPPVPWGRIVAHVVLRTLPYAALALAAVAFVAWARTTPGFAVKDVHVVGCDDVLRSRRQAELAGILGLNLFALDLAVPQERLLADPWIEAVVLRRVPPTTVVVVVTERRPVAWVARGAGFDLVDGAGTTLEAAADRAGWELPLIVLTDAGRKARDPTPAAATLAAIRDADAALFARVEQLEATGDGALLLQAEGTPPVAMAGPESVDELLAWLQSARALDAATGGVARVDARWKDRLYLTPGRT